MCMTFSVKIDPPHNLILIRVTPSLSAFFLASSSSSSFYTSSHTCTSRWSNGGGQFSPGENFSRIFRGEENFSPPLFSEFWCFPCGFWCQNSNWGGKYAQNSKWGEKKRGGDRPLTGGDKFSRNFLRGGKLTFPPLSLTLVHVWHQIYL